MTLSSAQAELVAAVIPCGESIGLTQLAADLGIPLVGHVHVDSPAAIRIANRKGNGKLRHVKVGMLWIQELVVEEEIILRKVKGENNVADILTKNVGVATLESACRVHVHDFFFFGAIDSLSCVLKSNAQFLCEVVAEQAMVAYTPQKLVFAKEEC